MTSWVLEFGKPPKVCAENLAVYELHMSYISFSSNNIIDAIKETNATGEVTAIPLKVPGSLKLTNKDFLQFRSSTASKIRSSITD